MRRRDDLDLARLLLIKAIEDETLVKTVADNADIADSIVGFHAQQTVEKLIKAVLSAHRIEYPKTHALGYLIVSVQESGIDAPDELSEADVLSPWAVDFRYNVPVALDRGASVSLLAKLRTWAEKEIDTVAESKGVEHASTLTVYEKPSCSVCRNLRALLNEHGVDFESVDYHVTGIEEGELRELLGKMGSGPREVLRMREPLVKELGLDRAEIGDDELIALMVEHPALVQRPIVASSDRAVLARPIERALELL